jgi:hypothetical protein
MIFLKNILCFSILFIIHDVGAQTNLLDNGDFESSCSGLGNWICMGGCTLTPNGDARTGSLSMQVSDRFGTFTPGKTVAPLQNCGVW